MKAIVIIFKGEIDEFSQKEIVTNMITSFAKSPGVSIDCETAQVSVLSDDEVTKCLVQHIVPPAEKPLKNEVELAKEVQLHAFCKDVLGTIGEQPLADQATYKRKFIMWMWRDEKAYNSEIVQSLEKPTKKQIDILREYGLQNIPAYLKLMRQL